MSDFKSRLEDEYIELMVKTEKLSTFINSERFKGVDGQQRHLMEHQVLQMKNYADTLRERMQLLGIPVL